MADDANLDLDVTTRHEAEGEVSVARIFVPMVRGYTRAAEPTLTVDCRSAEDLETEIERLKAELDRALEGARQQLGGAHPARRPSAEPAEEGAPAPPRARPRLGEGLLVRDVMTTPVETANRNDPLSRAEQLMSQGRFRHVVVLDEEDLVVGVLSRRDIFYGALGWSMGQGRLAHDRLLEATPVKDVMRTEVVTTRPDTPLAEAAGRMLERKIGCLPVVDADRLVGILTEGDFVTLLAPNDQPPSS